MVRRGEEKAGGFAGYRKCFARCGEEGGSWGAWTGNLFLFFLSFFAGGGRGEVMFFRSISL